jgi:hypothetical protein
VADWPCNGQPLRRQVDWHQPIGRAGVACWTGCVSTRVSTCRPDMHLEHLVQYTVPGLATLGLRSRGVQRLLHHRWHTSAVLMALQHCPDVSEWSRHRRKWITDHSHLSEKTRGWGLHEPHIHIKARTAVCIRAVARRTTQPLNCGCLNQRFFGGLRLHRSGPESLAFSALISRCGSLSVCVRVRLAALRTALPSDVA